MRTLRSIVAVALLAATQVHAQSSSSNATTLKLGSFVKDGVYAIANQLGLFTSNNLTIQYLTVPNSVAAYNNLLSGSYDLLVGTFDNTINRDINGQPTYPLNFTVIAGLDNAPGLALWSTSSYASPQALKGAVLGVDAVNSGYVYTLQKALALYGLQYPRDFSYAAIGATPNRVQALQQQQVNATLFTYPYTELTQTRNTHNLTLLLDIPTLIPQYQSGAVHVLTRNLRDNTTALYDKYVRFLMVQLQARQILLDSTQDQNTQLEVMQALQREFNTDAAGAQKLYVDCFLASGYFANDDLDISPTQAATTAYLRQQYGGFTSLGGNASSTTDISDLIFGRGDGHIINMKVRDAALARLQAMN